MKEMACGLKIKMAGFRSGNQILNPSCGYMLKGRTMKEAEDLAEKVIAIVKKH